MKYIKLAEELSQPIEGVALENRRIRTTIILALAASLLIPMPTSEVAPAAQEKYFYDNAEVLRKAFFEINESTPFNVDRALEVGCRCWRNRYNLAFNPLPGQLLIPVSLIGDLIPELAERQPYLDVTATAIQNAMGHLRRAEASA